MFLMRLQLAQLKQRFFPSAWRSQCLEMLDDADPIFGDELCWPSEKDRVRYGILLAGGEKASRIAKDDLGAANFVLSLIAMLAESQIASGDKHIDRGVLNPEGKSYRAIAETALYELREYELLDYEQLEDRLERLAEVVNATG